MRARLSDYCELLYFAIGLGITGYTSRSRKGRNVAWSACLFGSLVMERVI